MAVDFQSPYLKGTYGDRIVDDAWLAWCEHHLAPRGKHVVDVGCGGGIYARGFASLGARSVIGIDSSAQYIHEAQANSLDQPNSRFVVGAADATGLPDECADIIFSRALIHHLGPKDQASNAAEMHRILRPGGKCAVQDRTIEDVESEHPEYWIRATLFEVFPRLLEVERARRPSTNGYLALMKLASFAEVNVLTFAEPRKRYREFDELKAEILARKGKSILFELTDVELKRYCDALAAKSKGRAIVEMDSWTVWIGTSRTADA